MEHRIDRHRTRHLIAVITLAAVVIGLAPKPAEATTMRRAPALECVQGTGSGGTIAVRAFPYAASTSPRQYMAFSMELWAWSGSAWKKTPGGRTGHLLAGPIAGTLGAKAVWGNVHPGGGKNYAIRFAMTWYQNGVMKRWGPAFVKTRWGATSCFLV